jgi:hypothetical protein
MVLAAGTTATEPGARVVMPPTAEPGGFLAALCIPRGILPVAVAVAVNIHPRGYSMKDQIGGFITITSAVAEGQEPMQKRPTMQAAFRREEQ